jgi:DNA-binding transcriptional LysR family regulator
MPSSALRLNAKRWGLKALPIDLGVQLPAEGILTLKNRTLSPAVRVFIEHAREVAKSMAEPFPGIIDNERAARRRANPIGS